MLRENPEYLSYACNVEFGTKKDNKIPDFCSVLVSCLYRNSFSPKEERYFLKFLLVGSAFKAKKKNYVHSFLLLPPEMHRLSTTSNES